MKRLISTLLTITILTVAGGSLAHAQESDAMPAAMIDAGIESPPSSEPVSGVSEASEVGASDGEAEPDQGEADEPSPAELGSDMYGAIKAGRWIVAIGFGLALLVVVARRFGGKWAKTKIGGYALGFGIPLLSTLALSMQTGTWSLDAFLGALSVGFAASGLQRGAKHAKGIKRTEDAASPS